MYELSPTAKEVAIRLLSEGKKIEAIKQVRFIDQVGLKEAYDAIKRLELIKENQLRYALQIPTDNSVGHTQEVIEKIVTLYSKIILETFASLEKERDYWKAEFETTKAFYENESKQLAEARRIIDEQSNKESRQKEKPTRKRIVARKKKAR